jgi:phenylacetate-CoA ligase
MLGRLLFSLGTLANGESGFAAKLRETARIERESPDAVNAHIARKLRGALEYAASSTPWYKEHGVTLPANWADPTTNLNRFPVISKSDLQQSTEKLRASGYNGRIVRKTTGGSTGQPVTVYKNPDAVVYERAASWSFYQSYGINVGDRCIRFWGTPTTTGRSRRSRLADLASNRTTLSAFGIDDATLLEHWQYCQRVKAPFFYGYASMLATFAEFMEQRGLDGRQLGTKAIVSTSEVLTDAHRQLFTRVFGAVTRNEYGCGEFGPIAYECEEGLLHITYNNVVVEVVDTNGQPVQVGESGALLVTDLNNRAMPLVRFGIGDFAERGPTGTCRCGRNGPTLRRVWGREYDFVFGADGKRYHGEFLMYLFEDMAQQGYSVNQFQVVQEEDRSVELRLVGEHSKLAATAAALEGEARRRLPGLVISSRIVTDIERRSSGKTPLIIQRGQH